MRLPPPESLELARCDRFPEFERPLPVDRVGVYGGVPGPVRPGVNARFHAGILDYSRGDFDLASYHRSAWADIAWKGLLARLLCSNVAANGVVTSDLKKRVSGSVAGELETVRAFGPSSSPTLLYNQTDAFNNDDFELYYTAYGGDTPPLTTALDFEATLTAGPTFDDALFRVTATGARVHTDADRDTLSFKKAVMKWVNFAGTRSECLVDGTFFTSFPPVSVGQTVTLTFTLQV